MTEDNLYSIKEIAEMKNVSRGTVFLQVKAKGLGQYIDGKYYLTKSEISLLFFGNHLVIPELVNRSKEDFYYYLDKMWAQQNPQANFALDTNSLLVQVAYENMINNRNTDLPK